MAYRLRGKPRLRDLMPKTKNTASVALQGSVTQIVEEQGRSVMKILIEPFYLTYRDGLMLHLGDHVEVSGQFSITEVRQEFQSAKD